jgi:phosphatidylglycerophosphatase C
MSKELQKKVVAFDFDGTLTKKDTFIEFIRFYHGNLKAYLGFMLLAPLAILMKLKLLDNSYVKSLFFTFFFKGSKLSDFNNQCELFANEIQKILRGETMEKLKRHQSEGAEVIIISASIENWISPWLKMQNIKYLAGTKIEGKNGLITGNFSSNNCFGKEKVLRLLEIFPEREKYYLISYGDSSGDNELLASSNEGYLIKKGKIVSV